MSNREYLFEQRAWTSDDNDIIVVMNRSVCCYSTANGISCTGVCDRGGGGAWGEWKSGDSDNFPRV